MLGMLCACSSQTTLAAAAPQSGDDGGTAAALGPIAKDALGGSCSFGCEPGVACAVPDPSCTLGYCAFDGRPGSMPASYCTAECNDNCPDGYTCETAAHAEVRVCLALPERCGDGAIEGQELCDDGNMKDFDACSKDCKHGPSPVETKMRFGFASVITIAGDLPVLPKSNGCDAASVAQQPDGSLTLAATFCDAKTGKRMTLDLHVPNVAGQARLLVSDFQLGIGSIGAPASGDDMANPSCPSGNCGIKVTVGSVWGSAAGLHVTLEGAVATPGTQTSVVTNEVAAVFDVGPGRTTSN